MPRWTLLLLVVVAVGCAGVGVGLVEPIGTASFGWTAYSPLSASGNGVYMPVSLTWLEWRPRLGATLLALGAGTTGAAVVALLQQRPRAGGD